MDLRYRKVISLLRAHTYPALAEIAINPFLQNIVLYRISCGKGATRTPCRQMRSQTSIDFLGVEMVFPERRAMLPTPQQSIPGHPHVIIYRCAERRKAPTAHSCRLWTGFGS